MSSVRQQVPNGLSAAKISIFAVASLSLLSLGYRRIQKMHKDPSRRAFLTEPDRLSLGTKSTVCYMQLAPRCSSLLAVVCSYLLYAEFSFDTTAPLLSDLIVISSF
jgi:hypothetical protein